MQVILTKDFHPVGQKSQAVNVKPGYFRNYLQPNGIALAGTKKNLARAEEVNKRILEENAKLKKEAEKLKDTLKDTTLVLKEKLTKKGTLFAKVSAKEISTALKEQANIEISTPNVLLKEAIKKTGNFEVNLKLNAGVTAKVKLLVEGVE